MAEEYSAKSILKDDILEVINSQCPIETLAETCVLVTGATGLIGAQVVKTLLYANRECGYNIRVLAFCRSAEKFQRVFSDFAGDSRLIPVFGDINCEIDVVEKVDYIIHGASATSSKYFVEYPIETIMTAVKGTRNILEFASKKKIKSMIYLSSLEVYGIPNTSNGTVSEDQYGYIDPMSVRSSYSEGKRIAECLCVAYMKEKSVPVKIARLSQTFGPGVEYNDGRVFAEFARCAVEKRDIVLHTNGKTVRTYCYTKDAVAALIYILIKGKSGEAYNVSNEETAISICDMASLVCEVFAESGISVKYDIPVNVSEFGYNPEMIIRLDTSKLKKLGWKATVGLRDMYIRMIQSFETR